MHNAERSSLDFSDDFSCEYRVPVPGESALWVTLCPQILEADFQSKDTSFPNRPIFLKAPLYIS